MNLFKKSNYKETEKDTTQYIEIFNPNTRQYEQINLADYLNSFNNLEITNKLVDRKNTDVLKQFKNGIDTRINYINQLENELKQYDPDFEKIKKYKRILKELETQDKQGEK